jgi:hypothetical protein
LRKIFIAGLSSEAAALVNPFTSIGIGTGDYFDLKQFGIFKCSCKSRIDGYLERTFRRFFRLARVLLYKQLTRAQKQLAQRQMIETSVKQKAIMSNNWGLN